MLPPADGRLPAAEARLPVRAGRLQILWKKAYGCRGRRVSLRREGLRFTAGRCGVEPRTGGQRRSRSRTRQGTAAEKNRFQSWPAPSIGRCKPRGTGSAARIPCMAVPRSDTGPRLSVVAPPDKPNSGDRKRTGHGQTRALEVESGKQRPAQVGRRPRHAVSHKVKPYHVS